MSELDKNTDKDSISLEKIDSKNIEKSISKFEELEKRIFSYSNWITNVSLGLLGFYIAFLLQLRSSGILENIPSHKRIFFTIAIPITIGILIRIIREVKEYFTVFKSFRENAILWIESILKQFEKEGKGITDIKLKEKIGDVKEKIKSKKKRKDFYPAVAVYIQFLGFLYALIYVIKNLYEYLFN